MIEVHSSCPVCLGTKRMARTRECGTRVDVVTCPLCCRGVSVLGTHETLRPVRTVTVTIGEGNWKIWYPGDTLPTLITPTPGDGSILSQLIEDGTVIDGIVRFA